MKLNTQQIIEVNGKSVMGPNWLTNYTWDGVIPESYWETMDLVYENYIYKSADGYWHTDETMTDVFGPFPTLYEARQQCAYYCEKFLG